MAAKSDNLVGLLDMAGLLDLLNSSEGHERTDAAQPVSAMNRPC